MPNLHAHYYHGSVKAFRQELDGTSASSAANGGGGGGSRSGNHNHPGSASGGKSWSLSGMSLPVKADPNERDAFGRTVLHLAASSSAPQSYQFVQMLLRSPNLSVNLQDYESGYTALHRALYAGNIRVARDLLARSDTDVSIKDAEGLTAFDLYNGTVDGTNPPSAQNIVGSDLYTWGNNRGSSVLELADFTGNSTLGLGDSSDKSFPDRVHLLTQRQASDHPDPAQRFFHVGVKDVKMAKLHTAVVTAEAHGNLSLCGFGAGGRLGRPVHSQMPLRPLPDLSQTIVSIALAQDHTLAVTSGGYILSWGNNRFAQLGYAIEMPEKPSPFAKEGDEFIQATPKRIVGPLKKEWVRGVAAGRMSSACWTADAVWTWGTNLGHLGYEKSTNPTQVNPRKVTALSQPVIDVALSDYAMLCLLDSNEVLCFHHDTHFKINFSSPQKSLKNPRYPAHSSQDTSIVKVTSCGQTFATLSKKGVVCTFTLPHPSEEATKDVRDRHVSVKPQVLWALRKSFTAVRDVALGSDGTVIICTTSGHVFVRQRIKGGSGALKFRRIPYLQRVIKVAANETGGFAAIRSDARPTAITLKGKTLEEDLFSLQPHIRRYESQMTAEDFDRRFAPPVKSSAEDEEEESYNSVARDTVVAVELCQILDRWQPHHPDSLFAWSEPLLGSDIAIRIGEYTIPVHSVVLCLRAPAFARLLSGEAVPGFALSEEDTSVIEMDAVHPLVGLLLLQYIYSDEVASVWDSRVTYALHTKFPEMELPIAAIKADIARYADILDFAPLKPVLELGSKTPISTHTLPHDLASFFVHSSTPPSEVCDVVIALEDREVAVNSALLRARCPFFEAMFADQDWTLLRREDDKVVVHMEHLRWRPMKLVFKFIHEGAEDDLFDYLHQETLDEFLDFVFEVLAAATELLMDRLVLVCSRVIARHCNPFNAAALAVEASFYQATTLKLSIFDYIIECMETMLESGLLDDMDDDVLRDLSRVIATKQTDKTIVPRSNILVDELMVKHREWILLQDIPTPRVRAPQKFKPRSPLLVASDTRRPSSSPLATPDLKPLSAAPVDEIFSMDEETSTASTATPKAASPSLSVASSARPVTPLTLGGSNGPLSAAKGPVWKSRTVEQEKVDLRSIMAEAEATRTPARPPSATPQRINGSPASSSPIPGASSSLPRASPLSSSAGAAWRPVDTRRTSLAAVQAQQATPPPTSLAAVQAQQATPPPTSLAAVQAQQATPPPTSLAAVQAQQAQQATPPPPSLTRASGSMAAAPVGHVIRPQRLTPGSTSTSTPKRQGAAWATPTTYAAPAPVSPPSVSGTSQAFSLLAIQQQEQDAANRASRKEPIKSFAEIQEEERTAREERAREEEFQRWWAEEQARKQASGKGRGGAGGGASERGRGRGRGERRVANTQTRGKGRRAEPDGAEQANGNGAAEPKSSKGKGKAGRANGHAEGKPASSARIDDDDAGGAAGGQGEGGGRGRGGGGGRGRGRGGRGRRGAAGGGASKSDSTKASASQN